MEYLLKVSAVSIIFYLCYKVFLQRDTFFEHNRWFLLLGLITSFLIPLFVIPIYIEYTPIDLSEYTMRPLTNGMQPVEKPFNILDYLPILYGIGVLFFTANFIIQLASLSTVIFKNKRKKQERYTIVQTTNKMSPFSFFNWIVYNPEKFNKTELEQIITHEKVHARQYHSIDVLLTQLSCVVLWFNPFIWLYNKSIKQNLEFIADYKAQQKFNSKKSYQTTLLKTSMPSHQMALTNNFYTSLIKKRIVMLQKSKSKKINQLKYLLILPVLGWFLMSFNTQEIKIKKENIQEISPNQKRPFTLTIFNTITDSEIKSTISLAKTKGVTLKIKNLKRNADYQIIKISAEFKNSKGQSGSYHIDGLEPINSFYYMENNGVSGFFTESKTPFKIRNSVSNATVIGYGNENNKSLDTTENVKKPIYIINGEDATEEEFHILNPDEISSISVLKKEYAILSYGDKGENGIIKVITKQAKNPFEITIITKEGDTIIDKKPPLMVINGKISSIREFDNLNRNNLERYFFLRKEFAIKKYGLKGKNGAIEVTTKKKK
ncbi:M56 family metallopeptidase [Pseudalgibacter alginicilyticus]|nr:M56 family metallopeptidase [Pseudalgibacter alginicilyticus]